MQTMIPTNRTRSDFLQRFEDLIAAYNAGSKTIEQLFNDLLALSKSLDDEQRRHMREALTDEQLVLFDILTAPPRGYRLTRSRQSRKLPAACLKPYKDDW
jgi:type I restriction enzyme R subunit